MSDLTPEKATALRKPFPKESIGKLPKGGAMLDYVGHAAVTDRLLTVDPEWSWEPMATDDNGLPAFDRSGNLWIKLTICGVTRLGVGDGKNAKEVVGDAIRNAAMRFGVALDLWAKENLVEFAQAANGGNLTAAAPAPVNEPPATRKMSRPAKGDLTAKTRGHLFSLLAEIDPEATPEAQRAGMSQVLGRPIASRSELTEDDALKVIDVLNAEKRNRAIAAEQGQA